MAPISLATIKRRVQEKPDARNIYLVCEGTATEPAFLKALLSDKNAIGNPNVSFIEVEKTGREQGFTQLGKLIELAIKDIRSKRGFRKKYDKIVIFFDLDVYRNQLDFVRHLIHEYEKKDVIFVYTNPAIELFLLLTIIESFDCLSSDEKRLILKNGWVDNEGTQVRYAHKLLLEKSGIDAKHKDYDPSIFVNGFHKAVNLESMYLSTKLSDLEDNLISNFGDVFRKIENDDFDSFEYDLVQFGL